MGWAGGQAQHWGIICVFQTQFSTFIFCLLLLVCLGLRKNLSKKLSKICGDRVV